MQIAISIAKFVGGIVFSSPITTCDLYRSQRFPSQLRREFHRGLRLVFADCDSHRKPLRFPSQAVAISIASRCDSNRERLRFPSQAFAFYFASQTFRIIFHIHTHTHTHTHTHIHIHIIHINIYDVCGDSLFKQKIGIPMGTDCAPFLANLFLFANINGC